MKRALCFLLVSAFLLAAGPAVADQKIKTKMTFGQQSMESTHYLKGARTREEMAVPGMGSPMITIRQCDARKTIMVNEQANTCMVSEEPAAEGESAPAARPGRPAREEAAPSGPPRKGGVMTISATVTDTGERKNFFGYTARHLKTSMSMEASPDACNPVSSRMETDGWYIDFEPGQQSCARPAMPRSPMAQQRPDCQDRIHYSGASLAAMGRLGYPVDVTTTFSGEHGATTMRQQALEISRAPLNASLFEAPAGCRVVSSYAEMMGMGSMGDIMRQRGRAESAAPRASTGCEGEGCGAAPKRSGVVRVGVVKLEDKTGHAPDAEQLRQRLIEAIQYLGLEAVAADGESQEEIFRDAKQKQCDYVLYTDITALKEAAAPKRGGFGGMLGRATGAVSGTGGGGATEAGTAFRMFRINEPPPEQPPLDTTAEGRGTGAEETLGATFKKESGEVYNQVQKDLARRMR